MKQSIVACNPPCGNVAGRAPVGDISRLNHARAFADAANANHFSAEQKFNRDCFGPYRWS